MRVSCLPVANWNGEAYRHVRILTGDKEKSSGILSHTFETLVLGVETDAGPNLVRAESVVARIAGHMDQAGRAYFVESHVRGKPLGDLKKSVTDKFGLTDRQFTAIRMEVDGRVDAARESLKLHVESLGRRIASAGKKIARLGKAREASLRLDAAHRKWRAACKNAAAGGRRLPKIPKSLEGFHPGDAAQDRAAIRFQLHHKKRYLADLVRQRADRESVLKSGRIPVCFDGRKLFSAQNHPEENGFASLADWKAEILRRRGSNAIFVGSSDETNGNQTATLFPGNILRVRVPPALVGEIGATWVRLALKPFRRGQDIVEWNCLAGRKVAWRLMWKDVARGRILVAAATVDVGVPELPKDWRVGGWGADLNHGHVAAVRMDRFGNPIERKTFPFDVRDKSTEQVEAMLGDIVAALVGLARRDGVPLCLERLGFAAKKATLREAGTRYAGMLSSFVYGTFNAMVNRRAAREGVPVRRVNPAFTSVIGRVKFAAAHNMSVHHGAALAIVRRAHGLGEELRRCEPHRRTEEFPSREGEEAPVEGAGGHAVSTDAFPLPARTRGKHAWSDWRKVANMLRTRRANAWNRGRGTGVRKHRPWRNGMDHLVHVSHALGQSVRHPRGCAKSGSAVHPAAVVGSCNG